MPDVHRPWRGLGLANLALDAPARRLHADAKDLQRFAMFYFVFRYDILAHEQSEEASDTPDNAQRFAANPLTPTVPSYPIAWALELRASTAK